MNRNNVILAIIPARKGSKRIPDKNTKRLAGKPLIAYSITAARASRLITDIVVSTNDTSVAKIASRMHVPLFERPNALAQDMTPTLPVLEHVVHEFEQLSGKKVDIVVLLQPTSPLRCAADIDDTIRLVLDGAESAETFCKRSEHPSYAFTIDARDNAKPIDPRNVSKPLRALPERVFENGAVFALTRKTLLTKRTFYSTKHKGLIMPAERSIDIDEPIDFVIAEAIIRGK